MDAGAAQIQGAQFARRAAEVERILAILGDGCAMRVEPAALQPAGILLDLYGEDLRDRAFVIGDGGAELMLRPDFTVPIVRLHISRVQDLGQTASDAAYVYCGPVWRRQPAGSERATEYLQAGLEMFGGADPAAADAEVLARIAMAIGDAPVDLVTGDMGLVLAAIDALPTTLARKAALRRHVWRPGRFQALLHCFSDRHSTVSAARAELVAAVRERRVAQLIDAAGAPVGLRGSAEVAARADHVATEAATAPLAADAVAGMEAILAVAGEATHALTRFEALAASMPGLEPAVSRFRARLDAISARGIDPARLRFEASFGRTTLEYYDGFVFGAVPRGRPDLPPIASGGRYDALAKALGPGSVLPAVGGIIRPEALMAIAGHG